MERAARVWFGGEGLRWIGGTSALSRAFSSASCAAVTIACLYLLASAAIRATSARSRSFSRRRAFAPLSLAALAPLPSLSAHASADCSKEPLVPLAPPPHLARSARPLPFVVVDPKLETIAPTESAARGLLPGQWQGGLAAPCGLL